MTIGFGIIGCGMIAGFHAKAISGLRGAKLVGCYDMVVPSVDYFAKKFNCRGYYHFDQFLDNKDIQVVTVCTPSGVHMEVAVPAAEAGKHVIVEKPLEITLERCDRIISACEKAGVQLATIFPSRFHKNAQLVKQAIEQERFGRLTLGDAYVKWYRTQEYYDSGAWRGTWEFDGGGALMNQGIHSVDLLLWFMGPIAEITACTATLAHERIEVEDVAVAALRFANGALGTIEASTAVYPGFLKRIEIHGSEGSAVIEEENLTTWQFVRSTSRDRKIQEAMAKRTRTGGGAADPAAIGYHGHRALFKDFIDALASGRKPLIDGYEGRRSVEAILAIYKAAETRRAVELPLKGDPKLKARRKAKELKPL